MIRKKGGGGGGGGGFRSLWQVSGTCDTCFFYNNTMCAIYMYQYYSVVTVIFINKITRHIFIIMIDFLISVFNQ